jgi:hypothetical protein
MKANDYAEGFISDVVILLNFATVHGHRKGSVVRPRCSDDSRPVLWPSRGNGTMRSISVRQCVVVNGSFPGPLP